MRLKIIATATLAASFTLSSHAADIEDSELKIIGGLSITTQSSVLERPFWNDVISSESQGKIKAQITPWNEMGLKGPEVFRMVSNGVADAATGFLGHVAGDIPQSEGLDLAGLSPSYEQFQTVVSDYRPVLTEHYRTLGLEVLGVWSYQAQVIVCTDPIASLSDLDGRRVRTSGATQADLVSHFGGSGVPVPFGEVQQALINGVIDCAISGTLGIYKAKWWEGAKHMYPLPVTWGAIAFAMSSKTWAKTPEANQEFLSQQIAGLESSIWDQNAREHQEGVDCNGQGPCPHGDPAGITVSDISDGDKEALRDALLQTVLPAWAKRCGNECAEAWNKSVGSKLNLTASAG